jgi:hypothetical protein
MSITDENGDVVIYVGDDGKPTIEVTFQGETAWLTQAQLTDLFQSSKANVSEHIKHIFKEGELQRESVVRKFRTTASDGKRYEVNHYDLDMIISLGYRVKSKVATQFRIWATERLHEYIVKGFAMNDERLKNGGGRYFRELLQRVRDIRSSERNLYQQVTDIYATALDYDPKNDLSQQFFATVQNKMHYAAHLHTAAEVVHTRVDSSKPMIGMTNFKGDYITKEDVSIAKNFLNEKELQILNLIVGQYLDFAELQAIDQKTMTMKQWISKLDEFLVIGNRKLLDDKGNVSHIQAVKKAEAEYIKYRQTQMSRLESDFDRTVRQLAKKTKKAQKDID